LAGRFDHTVPGLMAILKFHYSIYDDYERGETIEHLVGQGVPQQVADQLVDEINGIGVTLHFEHDTATGQTTRIGVSSG